MPLLQHLPTPERESLSRYGSDSQIRKDWKAILAKAESDLAAAEQATRTIQAALREIEWAGTHIDSRCCPACNAFPPDSTYYTGKGHHADCIVAAALRQSPPPTETP
jgi:hypothetical protein